MTDMVAGDTSAPLPSRDMSTLSATAETDEEEDQRAGAAPVQPDLLLAGLVIAVIAYKGGVGKTTLAYELAYLLGAVLVDFEHDEGSATVTWGYDHRQRVGAPLIDAISKGGVPQPLKGVRKPDLVPGHPDLATTTLPAHLVTEQLLAWAKAWNRPVVVDAHPGGTETTRGVAAAASVIVSPVVLGEKELQALDGMTTEMADYPILVVPNKFRGHRVADEGLFRKLDRISSKPGVTLGPFISDYGKWLPNRTQRVALTSYDPVPKRIEPLDGELRAVAREVRDDVVRQQQ